MQTGWLLRAANVGICMGLAVAAIKATDMHCLSVNSRLTFPSVGELFKHKMLRLRSRLGADLGRPYGFSSPHISLSLYNQKLRSASFNINTAPNFNHLQFFNSIQEIWHQLSPRIKGRIENCKRVVKDNIVLYQFQYFTLNKKNEKITTVIRLIGDTRTDSYKFSIESEGRFSVDERELVLNVLQLADKSGAALNNDFKALSRISKAGWNVVEASDNDLSLARSFGKDSLRKAIEAIKGQESATEGTTANIVGSKGSGKRHLGKVLAYEEHAPFVDVPLNDLVKRPENELAELLKDLAEVKKAVVFLNNAAKDEGIDEKVSRFMEELKKNKGLIILLASDNVNPDMKDAATIRLQSPNLAMYKEILKEFAAHLPEKEADSLAETIDGMSVGKVIGVCKYVEKYWREHYRGADEKGAPLKLM